MLIVVKAIQLKPNRLNPLCQKRKRLQLLRVNAQEQQRRERDVGIGQRILVDGVIYTNWDFL